MNMWGVINIYNGLMWLGDQAAAGAYIVYHEASNYFRALFQ